VAERKLETASARLGRCLRRFGAVTAKLNELRDRFVRDKKIVYTSSSGKDYKLLKAAMRLLGYEEAFLAT
jgi:hypothetical protein